MHARWFAAWDLDRGVIDDVRMAGRQMERKVTAVIIVAALAHVVAFVFGFLIAQLMPQ